MAAGAKQRKLCRMVEDIPYTLTYKRVKNLNLRVSADGEIQVSAPHRIPLEEVDRFVASRREWISRALERTRRRAAETQAGPVAGGTVYYLGEPYRVEVLAGKPGVTPVGRSFIFTQLSPEDSGESEELWRCWLKSRCGELLPEICEKYVGYFRAHGCAEPHYVYRDMRSRWGSCNRQTGRVAFSIRLLTRPLAAVEYVVVHELCHLIEPNHSQRFHALVRSFLPDEAARRALLR